MLTLPMAHAQPLTSKIISSLKATSHASPVDMYAQTQWQPEGRTKQHRPLSHTTPCGSKKLPYGWGIATWHDVSTNIHTLHKHTLCCQHPPCSTTLPIWSCHSYHAPPSPHWPSMSPWCGVRGYISSRSRAALGQNNRSWRQAVGLSGLLLSYSERCIAG